jgi:hypothetical protein
MPTRRYLALVPVLAITTLAISLLLLQPWESHPKDEVPQVAESHASPTASSTSLIPAAADVTYVELGFGGGPFRPEVPLPLGGQRPGDKPTIAKLLGWLAAAEEIESQSEAPSPSMLMSIHATDSIVRVADGWNCTRTENSESCVPTADEVIVQRDGDSPVHLRSPDLVAWLHEGWRAEMNMGTPEDVQSAVRYLRGD